MKGVGMGNQENKYQQFYNWSEGALTDTYEKFLKNNKTSENQYALEDYFSFGNSKCLDYIDYVFDTKLEFEKKEKDIRFVYCRLANSLQSSSHTNFVDFKKKEHAKAFCKLLHRFNPCDVVNEHKVNDKIWESIDHFFEAVIDELQIREETRNKRGVKLKWESYAAGLYNGARYLSQFRDSDAFKNDLWKRAGITKESEKYGPKYNETMIKAMLKVKEDFDIVGLGETLTPDFLKDSGIIDCGKPDRHIMGVLNKLFPHHGSYHEILDKIAEEASYSGKKVSVYQVTE
jgi:hypothetical protein